MRPARAARSLAGGLLILAAATAAGCAVYPARPYHAAPAVVVPPAYGPGYGYGYVRPPVYVAPPPVVVVPRPPVWGGWGYGRGHGHGHGYGRGWGGHGRWGRGHWH